jgi:putative transcriptional regulator
VPAIRRHPSEATLVAHAAGTLWAAAKPVVQGHLDLCEHCRVAFGLAEAVGGALLDELPPTPLSPDALRRVTERLGGRAGAPAQPAASPAPAAVAEDAAMSPPRLRDVRLRWLAPGVRHAVLLRGPADGTLRLLRVRPSGARLTEGTHWRDEKGPADLGRVRPEGGSQVYAAVPGEGRAPWRWS